MLCGMETTNDTRHRIPRIAALAAFAIHLLGNPHYGYFRDELYFIICGQHPQWGYVDQPPVAPLLAAASQLFGHSLILLRAVPALFAGAGAYVTCLLVLEMGGGAFAEVVAALVVFFTPVLMNFGMKVSPDMVGLWLWPLLALLVVRLTKGASPRLWLVVGVILGCSIQSKYSVLFFAVGLLVGLLLAPERRILFSPWLLIGVVLAGLIALPNFLWQAHYGYPMLELLRNVQQGKNIIWGPLQYVMQELLITGFFLAAVWVIGLGWLFSKARLRFLAYSYIILIGLMILFHGKSYYPADAYPYLIAAGGVAIETWTRGLKAVRASVIAAVFLFGMAFLPLAMPVLPETEFVSYAGRLFRLLRIQREAIATEHHRLGVLPSDWADMHGWPELAAQTAQVYQSLPPADRAQAVILAQNYGEAAAIEFFGGRYGLPPVISGHNSYYLWGPGSRSGNVLICVGGNCDKVAEVFTSVERAASFSSPWIQPFEDGIPIMVCRGIKEPLPALWPRARFYE